MENCPICFEPDRLEKFYKCSHEICNNCCLSWKKHQNTCPCCRAAYSPPNIGEDPFQSETDIDTAPQRHREIHAAVMQKIQQFIRQSELVGYRYVNDQCEERRFYLRIKIADLMREHTSGKINKFTEEYNKSNISNIYYTCIDFPRGHILIGFRNNID